MINPQKPVINPIKNFNRFTALILIRLTVYYNGGILFHSVVKIG